MKLISLLKAVLSQDMNMFKYSVGKNESKLKIIVKVAGQQTIFTVTKNLYLITYFLIKLKTRFSPNKPVIAVAEYLINLMYISQFSHSSKMEGFSGSWSFKNENTVNAINPPVLIISKTIVRIKINIWESVL